MEHWYIVSGNEFGLDLTTKVNFKNEKDAYDFFEKTVSDDENYYFGTLLMYVNKDGAEKELKQFINE